MRDHKKLALASGFAGMGGSGLGCMTPFQKPWENSRPKLLCRKACLHQLFGVPNQVFLERLRFRGSQATIRSAEDRQPQRIHFRRPGVVVQFEIHRAGNPFWPVGNSLHGQKDQSRLSRSYWGSAG
jgi:hypothetical protein